MQVDGVAALVPLAEVVAREHLRHGEARGERDQVVQAQVAQPLRVVAHDRLRLVQDLRRLLEVGRLVRADRLRVDLRAQLVLVGRVADERRHVADQEHRLVAEVLELAQLAQRHRVPQRERGRRRVDAEVDAQGAVLLQPLAQLRLEGAPQASVAVLHAAHEREELLVHGGHRAAHDSSPRTCATSCAICARNSSGPAKARSGRTRSTIAISMRSS